MIGEHELVLAGMNVPDFLARVMNNESLVKLFISKFVEDENFARLSAAFAAGDAATAESACHTLKGMCGNMSLTRLFTGFQQQLAHLRAGAWEAAKACQAELSALHETAVQHLRAFLASR